MLRSTLRFMPPFALVLALAAVVESMPPQRSKDYRTPELRGRVERLKQEVAAGPTTAANYLTRVKVLWDWGNAFALTGALIPVDLPNIVRRAAQAEVEKSPPPGKLLNDIDGAIYDLRVKDEHPEGIGPLQITSDAPLVAATWVTVEQVYTAGTLGMAPGGVILVGAMALADQGDLQHENPAGDNYVSIRTSRTGARFERIRIPFAGMMSGSRGDDARCPAFRLTGSRLEKNDAVTITWGDRSGGSPGFRVQTIANDRLLLPLYLDLEGRGQFLTPAWPAFRVVGQPEVKEVRAFVPSIVAVGEPFDLSVRSADRYNNRATGAIPEYEVLLNGKPWRRIPAGDKAVVVLPNVELRAPGVYRFALRSAAGTITGASNPIRVERNPAHRIYWGETHGHCRFAEGQ